MVNLFDCVENLFTNGNRFEYTQTAEYTSFPSYATLNMFIFDAPDSAKFYWIVEICVHAFVGKIFLFNDGGGCIHIYVFCIEMAIIETDMQHINWMLAANTNTITTGVR